MAPSGQLFCRSSFSFLNWAVMSLLVGLARCSCGTTHKPSTPVNPIQPSNPDAALWQPPVGARWQVVLNNPIKVEDDITLQPDVDIWVIDLFDNSASTIAALTAMGKKVVCYLSGGTVEEWRSDADQFDESDKGHELYDWDGERWLDTRSQKVRDIMATRIAMAKEKGCHAIDPDNVDVYDNDSGLDLNSDDSADYFKFLAEEAHGHGMSIGLKNSADIIQAVLPLAEFAINEQCAEYGECENWLPFINAGKPVFVIEYPEEAAGLPASDTYASEV